MKTEQTADRFLSIVEDTGDRLKAKAAEELGISPTNVMEMVEKAGAILSKMESMAEGVVEDAILRSDL